MSDQPDDSLDVSAELDAAALVEELYDWGCRWIGQGFPIIPVNGKKPCNAAGHPARRWQKGKCEEERLARGLRGAFDPKRISGKVPASEPGIGLRMGPGSCIDIEADSDDERAAIKHLFRGCRKPKTVSYTSNRGRHDLYRYDERLAALGRDVFEYKKPGGQSVKIRVGGQKAGAQSVLPPSPGRNWLLGCNFAEIEPAVLPELVIERLLAQAKERLRPALHPTPQTVEMPSKATSNGKKKQAQPHTHQSSPTANPINPFAVVADHVLRGSYESRSAEVVGAEIMQAFDSSVPTCFQERHKAIWALVRRLRVVPELGWITRDWLELAEGRAWLWPLLDDWFNRGRCFFDADFDECWNDFVEGWGKVKRPWGRDLQMAYQLSLAEPLPDDLASRLGIFDCENNRRLVSFCAVLQRAYGDKPFPLDGRAAGKILGWPQTRVCRKLRTLCDLGILQRTFAGIRKRAAEYLYLPTVERTAASVGPTHKGHVAAAA